MLAYQIAFIGRALRSAIGVGVFMAVASHLISRWCGAPLSEAAQYACFACAALPTFFFDLGRDD
jgi:hypothetical protein